MTSPATTPDRYGTRGISLLLMAAGIVGMFVILYLVWQIFIPGEEPTIKIKGGSVLVGIGEAEWVEEELENQPTAKWTHNGRESRHERYFAHLVTAAGKKCDPIVNPVRQVTILSSGKRRLVLNFNARRTVVNPTNGKMVRETPRRLKLADSDDEHISEIQLRETRDDGPVSGPPNWSCEFESKKQFTQLMLCGSDNAGLCEKEYKENEKE